MNPSQSVVDAIVFLAAVLLGTTWIAMLCIFLSFFFRFVKKERKP